MDSSQGGGPDLAAVEGEGRQNGTPSLDLASNEDCGDAGDSLESQCIEVPDLERGSGENLLGAIMADVSSTQPPWQSARNRRKRWKKPRRRIQQKPKSKDVSVKIINQLSIRLHFNSLYWITSLLY